MFGPPNDAVLQKYATNPIYFFKVVDPDLKDAENKGHTFTIHFFLSHLLSIDWENLL